MTAKRKRTVWLVVCLLWELLVIGFYIYMYSLFKFPKLNFDFLGWLIPIFIVVPLLALLFGVLSVRRKKELMEAFAIIFAVLSALLYCAHIFLSLFMLSPIMSETNNKDDYLVLDNDMEFSYEDIVGVIPEAIPENATNVVYNYHYVPWEDGWIYFYWELPEDEYEAFKNETLQKDGTIEKDSRGIIFYPSWNTDGFLSVKMDLNFNDENNSIICNFERCFAC